MKNRILLKLVLGGVGAWAVLYISLLVMNRFNTTESAFFISFDVFPASKGFNYSDLICSQLGFHLLKNQKCMI